MWALDVRECSCSVASQRWCTEKKVLENISLVLGRGGAIMPATISAEMLRHPSCWVGLQAVGGVPGEGQSAHLASRFVGSAPTRVLSVHRCPEKSWKNSADCCDCYTATHAKRNVPQEMRKFLNVPLGGILAEKKLKEKKWMWTNAACNCGKYKESVLNNSITVLLRNSNNFHLVLCTEKPSTFAFVAECSQSLSLFIIQT